jgi:hypothetical protein
MSWPRACGSCSLRPRAVGTLAQMPAPICLFRRKDRFCGRSGSTFRAAECLQRVETSRSLIASGTVAPVRPSFLATTARRNWVEDRPGSIIAISELGLFAGRTSSACKSNLLLHAISYTYGGSDVPPASSRSRSHGETTRNSALLAAPRSNERTQSARLCGASIDWHLCVVS